MDIERIKKTMAHISFWDCFTYYDLQAIKRSSHSRAPCHYRHLPVGALSSFPCLCYTFYVSLLSKIMGSDPHMSFLLLHSLSSTEISILPKSFICLICGVTQQR